MAGDKGGPGSGNFGHAGRPGEVGGSAPGGGGPGGLLTQSPAARAEAYTGNPRFRALADGVSLYTQGSYRVIRDTSVAVVSGEGLEKYDFTIGEATHPMASYTAMVEGQDLEHSEVSLPEAVTEMHLAVASAPELEGEMYRGFDVPQAQRYDYENDRMVDSSYTPPKVGAMLDIQGITSFTTDLGMAERFGLGKATGQRRRGSDFPQQCVIIEVEAGARALDVRKLSPWRQKEVLSAGRFEVLSVVDGPGSIMYRGNSQRIPRVTRVRLRQTSVWNVGG